MVDDAHLVTDAYFEPEPGKRFGSGRLVSDFLEHARLRETDRKLVVLSDPYHVTQASESDILPAPDLWERYGLTGQAISLDQLVRHDERGGIIDNALALARHISDNSFGEFDFIRGNGLTLEPGKVAAERGAELICSSPTDILFIAFSNAEVSKLNDWARRQRFCERPKPQVVSGDVLEMHSFVRLRNPLEHDGIELSAGDLIVVQEAGEVRSIQQRLKRGKGDIAVEFQVQEVRPSGSDTPFLLLVDFLLAESKEIPENVQVASQVWSKSQAINEPIKARFGYAATAHHARAIRRLRTIVAPPKSIGRHNENYFRWLYTAITRATHACVVANWKPLSVFDEVVFDESIASSKTSIRIGSGMRFDPERSLTADERNLVVPDGVPTQPEALKETVAVWLAIQPTLDLLGYQARSIQHHPYQAHFTLRGPEDFTCGLKVSYKGDHTISAIQADDPEIYFQICEGVTSRIQLNADQTRIIKALPKLPNLEDVLVVSLRPTDYRIQSVVGNLDEGLAELELNYTGEGMVSSVRLLHYTDEAIRDRIARAFQNEEAA